MSRILVIDDSELIVQLLQEFLTSHGFDVEIARDATAGYEMAVSQPPDLILLDVKLPDVTGFELLRTLRNRIELRAVPVIMLTATAQSPAEKVQGFQQGADDYVLKPFDNGELLERIRIQLRKRSESLPQEPLAQPAISRAESPTLPDDTPVSLSSWIPDVLFSPSALSPTARYQGAALLLLLGGLILLPVGLFFSSASSSTLLNVALSVIALWGVMVGILVVSASFFGVSLRGGEAAKLLGMASVPLVLKWFCAALFSAWTTLSPFYFTAGPMLFSGDLPRFWARCDVLEGWSLGLLAYFLSRYPKSSRNTATILTGVILLLILLVTSFASAQDGLPVKTLTLEQYESEAIEKGIQGRLTELSLESAGYTRSLALRATSSPQLRAIHSQSRAESEINSVSRVTESRESTLRLTQPTILGTDIQAEATRGTNSKPGLNATVTQPLYLLTRNASLRTRQRAELNFANARENYDAAILSIRAQARSQYYSVMQGEESIRVEERKAASSRKLLEIIQVLVDGGKTAPVETMRAKIRAQTDDRQLQNARTSYQQAVLSAKNYLGWPLEEPLVFSSRLAFKPMDISVDRLLEYALLHRPELRTLRRQQELARLDLQESQEPTLPGFTVSGSANYRELNHMRMRSWSLTGQASWLFFDSFMTRDRVRLARIDEWVAQLNLSNSERDTRVDVQNAWLDVKRAEKQIQEFQFSREQTKRNVDVVRLRFQNGLERLIDVFDAENEMRNLDNEYLNLLVSYNRAKDNLSRFIGVDVETLR